MLLTKTALSDNVDKNRGKNQQKDREMKVKTTKINKGNNNKQI